MSCKNLMAVCMFAAGVIPGHGRLADETDVIEFLDMNTILRDRFLDAIKKGMTLEQSEGCAAGSRL